MNRKRLQQVILGSAGAVVLAGGALLAAAEYQAGHQFAPTESDRALNVNQVVFPEQEKRSETSDRSQDDNSEMWEKDRNADDSEHPRDNGNADYLFESRQTLSSDANQTAAVAGDTPNSATAGAGTAGADTIYDITKDTAGADVILDGGRGNGIGTGGEEAAPTAAPRPTADPGGSGGSDPQPTAGPQPTLTPVPSATPHPGQTVKDPETSKSTPMPDPSTPNHSYDETVKPKLDGQKYNVYIGASFNFENMLYFGQEIDTLMIYNSLETYVMTESFDRYIWGSEDYDKYVRISAVSFDGGETWIDEFPVTIPEDLPENKMVIRAEYRLSTADDWTTEDVEYEVQQSRILVLNTRLEEGTERIDPDTIISGSFDQYSQIGEKINLLGYQQTYLGSQEQLTQLFPGWTENGELVPWFYPVTGGRHVLEPAESVDFDSDTFYVQLKMYWMTEQYDVIPDDEISSEATLTYLQTLTTYKGETNTAEDGTEMLDTLTVPEGIQAVVMPHYPYLQVETLGLPASVLYVDTSGVMSVFDSELLYNRGLMVTDAYTVAEDNPHYTAQNGLLYNQDGTQLLGVPTGRTELDVSADVTKVVLPYQNHLKTLTLEADSVDALPDVNYARLARTSTILVQDDLLDDYLTDQRDTLQSNRLHVASQQAPEKRYTVKDDLAVTDDGVVHLTLSDGMRWVSLPDYVTGLESGSLQGTPELSALLLPADGETIDFADGCFAGTDNLEIIGCYSQQQYNAAVAAAPEGVAVALIRPGQDGYTYLEGRDGVLLLGVPVDITEFDGTVPTADGPLAITAIGDGVFRDCGSLTWVTLTDEINAIGYQAFQNCTSLQGVVIGATPNITIGKLAFDGCSSLRFVASNAANGDVQDDSLALPSSAAGYTFLYCLNGSTGYNSNWLYFDPDDIQEYKIEDCGGAKVLYGVDSYGNSWLALRAANTVTGTVTLPVTTTTIHSFSFEDTRTADDTAFTLNWDELTALGAINAAAFRRSSLGGDITLSAPYYFGANAFDSCTKLENITLEGDSLRLGNELFMNCSSLESATLGGIDNDNEGLSNNSFGGCSSLKELTFTSSRAPKLVLSDMGIPFYFNMNDWNTPEAEQEHLTVHVPEGAEETYIDSWRYGMAGYASIGDQSAYQVMWSYIYTELNTAGDGTEPTDEEVRAELDSRLLVTENRVRTLLGVETIDAITHPYTYEVDENGIITLTEARGVTNTGLTGEELEMPYGWALDYIGAGAFADSPDLDTVSLPDTLVGIHHNAFAGVQIDMEDESDGLMLITSGNNSIPALVLEAEGVPFSFGVPDERVAVMDFMMTGADDEMLIQQWTLPMIGYYTVDDLRLAVTFDLMDEDGNLPDDETVEAEVTARLLAGENRVRALLWQWEPITDPAEMVFKENPDDSSDTGDGDTDLPDWPDELPDLFIATPETAIATPETAAR